MEDKYSCHNYKPLPVVIEKGERVYVWDVEGKRYFDFLSCYSSVNQGHCHPKIIKAMEEQLKKPLTLTSRAFYNNIFPQYAKFMSEYFNYDAVLPANSGAEAVESAIKLCRKWGYEKKGIPKNEAIIISCKDNFHGRTISIVSMSNDPDATNNFGPFTPGLHGNQIPFNDVGALQKFLEEKGKYVAGFLLEPIQGEAGVIIPKEGYLKSCYDLCKKHNVLLIADEVQAGLGRTGKLLTSHYDNIKPDIVILGKALSGGVYPISAVLADWNIMEVIKPGQHGSTFAGNPLASKIAMAALSALKDEGMVENSYNLGKDLKIDLEKLLKKGGIVKEVRAKGLWAAIVIDHSNNKMEGLKSYDLCKYFKKNGLLAKQTHEDTIRLAPPLVITKDELKECTGIITKCIESIEQNGFKKVFQ